MLCFHPIEIMKIVVDANTLLWLFKQFDKSVL